MNVELIKNLKVLYVEDEVVLRDTTCCSLNSILKEVVVAENGQDGLEKFKNEEFDLIITDLLMPVMTGTDMIIEIRKENKDIPIIVTTAYGSKNEDIIKLKDIGIDGYVMKPIDLMKLFQEIDQAITK